MIEQEVKKYNIAVKVKQVPLDPDTKCETWGIRAEYYNGVKKNVKKFADVNGDVYTAMKRCVTFSGESKTVTASSLKSRLKYEQMERLCSYPFKVNEQGTKYFILTHPNRYTAYSNAAKGVFFINPYIQNNNLIENAIIVNLDEVKKLFDEIKDEWKTENNLANHIAVKEKLVRNLITKDTMLELAVKEATKKLETMKDVDEKTKFTQEDVDNYHLSRNRDWLKRLGEEYIDNDYDAWDKIWKINRKVEVYQNVSINKYNDYMDRDYDLTLNQLREAKDYVELTYLEGTKNLYPMVDNHSDWDRTKGEYGKVRVEDLPNLELYYAKSGALNLLKIEIKKQRHKMIMRMLSFLNPKGSVITCTIPRYCLSMLSGEEE